jgi:hypothetical protein
MSKIIIAIILIAGAAYYYMNYMAPEQGDAMMDKTSSAMEKAGDMASDAEAMDAKVETMDAMDKADDMASDAEAMNEADEAKESLMHKAEVKAKELLENSKPQTGDMTGNSQDAMMDKAKSEM